MNSTLPELKNILQEYNDILQIAQSKAFFVRGKEFQDEQILILDELIKKIDQLKILSIEKQDEKEANFLLCLKLAAKAVWNELRCIIALKKDDPVKAWDYLIDAQNQISLSIRNNPFGGDYLMGYANRLHLYEVLLFPKLPFISRGCIVAKTKCSICDQSFDVCDHLKGYAYMGKICSEIIEEIVDLEEISLVENPADKKCRILSYSENGKSFETFTLREIPIKSANNDSNN